MRQLVRSMLPTSVKWTLLDLKERGELALLSAREFCSANIAEMRVDQLNDLFVAPDLESEWEEVGARTAPLVSTAKSGGVNRGDRRAIYYLIRKLAPINVLEIGTHIGASTIHISSALAHAHTSDATARRTLDTVDIGDVNDPVSKPWTKYSALRSPKEMVQTLHHEDFVRFIVSPAVPFLTDCKKTYDFIFLDGDHSAKAVYREISLALKRLSPGGHILLHDYFPGLEPLWPESRPIKGPALGVRRIMRENPSLAALPLGALPWPTKYGTNITSLALLVRRGPVLQ